MQSAKLPRARHVMETPYYRPSGFHCSRFTKGKWYEAYVFPVRLAWASCWTRSKTAGDLRRYDANVTPMWWTGHPVACTSISLNYQNVTIWNRLLFLNYLPRFILIYIKTATSRNRPAAKILGVIWDWILQTWMKVLEFWIYMFIWIFINE